MKSVGHHNGIVHHHLIIEIFTTSVVAAKSWATTDNNIMCRFNCVLNREPVITYWSMNNKKNLHSIGFSILFKWWVLNITWIKTIIGGVIDIWMQYVAKLDTQLAFEYYITSICGWMVRVVYSGELNGSLCLLLKVTIYRQTLSAY